MSKKIIDPAVSRFPIRTCRFCDSTRVPHFHREQVRLRQAVPEGGIIVKGAIACDATRPRGEGLRRSDAWQKPPVAANGKNLVGGYQRTQFFTLLRGDS